MVGPVAQATTTPEGEPLLVYGVFATPLEEPWDGAIHTAIEAVAESGAIEYKWVDGLGTSDEMERGLRDIIETDDPDLIIGDAFAAEEAVRAVAADYPDTAFAFGSGCRGAGAELQRVRQLAAGPGYLAGMLAGGLTESGTIGVVAAMPIPEVNRIVNAFVLGVGETNADATVNVSFINSFFDPATAAQAAEAQIAQGADVLFAERAGVIEVADENDLPVIGMMVDQQELAPDNVVTSLVWNMQPTVEALVEQVVGRHLRGPEPGPVLVHGQRRQLDRPDQHRPRRRGSRRSRRPRRGAPGGDPRRRRSRRRSTRRRRRVRSTSRSR